MKFFFFDMVEGMIDKIETLDKLYGAAKSLKEDENSPSDTLLRVEDNLKELGAEKAKDMTLDVACGLGSVVFPFLAIIPVAKQGVKIGIFIYNISKKIDI